MSGALTAICARTPDRVDALEELARSLGDRARLGAPLGARTTYRVGGPGALVVEAEGEDDLVAVHRSLGGTGVPVLVLGKGSNLLVADAGFCGVVVVLGEGVATIEFGDGPGPGEGCRGRAGGAVGVPGTVGGAVRMNAGGHGSDIASCLVRYGSFDLVDGRHTEAGPQRLEFGYRRSAIGASEVVLWAELAARPGPVEKGREALAEIVRWRRQHQPGGSNAGSVFTNPPGDSAGRLVEAAGLKGFRLGTARVSEKHANFIQADEGGSADDVRRLIEHVREVVAARFGVALATEVRLVGFDS